MTGSAAPEPCTFGSRAQVTAARGDARPTRGLEIPRQCPDCAVSFVISSKANKSMKTKSAREAKAVKSTSTRKIKSNQKITPFLWFDGQAQEAANFYTSIFDNSKILDVARYGEVRTGAK